MSALNFSIGGKLDSSYAASLKRAEDEAKASALRIQNSLRSRLTTLQGSMSKMDPASPEYTAAIAKQAALQRSLLAVQNAQYLASAKARISAGEREAETVAKTTGHMLGLNAVIRESIVLLREASRGNWTRLPGSASVLTQNLSNMGPIGKGLAFLNRPLFNSSAAAAEGAAAGEAGAKGLIAALSSIPLITMGIVAASLAAIVAAPLLFLHRVKRLTEDLGTTIASTFNPSRIAPFEGKLNTIANLHADMADEAWRAAAAYDSISETIGRQLDLTRDKIRGERELLEIQKSNELAAAKNPAQRAAIEKKYSGMILDTRQKERDAELKALKDRAAALPVEMAKHEDEIEKLTFSGEFVGAARDKQITEMKKDASANADAYFKQLGDGEKDTRTHSADADRKIIAELQAREGARHTYRGPAGQQYEVVNHLDDEEKARLAAAQARLKDAAVARNDYAAWSGMADTRERSRQRVKDLEDMVKKDQAELTKLGNDQHGEIADKIRRNLQDHNLDLALERAHQARVDPGAPLHGREVTGRQRIGFGAPQFQILDVNKSMDRTLKQILAVASRRPAAGGHGSFADPLSGDHF